MAEEGSPSLLSRGDELLTLVQSDALEAQVIALQENFASGRNVRAHRTRSAHHREATDGHCALHYASVSPFSSVRSQ